MNNMIKTTLFAGAALMTTVGANATERAAGVALSNSGLGISYSQTAPWQFREGDQIQLRGIISSADIDNADDQDLSGNDYKINGDSKGAQLGFDWYPFANERFQSVFVSTGVSYTDYSISGRSEPFQYLEINGKQISAGDEVYLDTKIEDEVVAPYVSFGWGNRLREDRNWYFQVEAGVYLSSSDPEVSLSANDPNNLLTAADIEAERRDIQDDYGNGFVSMGISYKF